MGLLGRASPLGMVHGGVADVGDRALHGLSHSKSSGLMGRVINVLLIEDSEGDALFFRMGLRTSSARLVRVADTEAATKHLEMQPLPDLIVMDLRLPGMPVNRFLD